MRAFEYASPTTKSQAVGLLSGTWGETEVLAGGTDLLSLMKDDVATPKRLVSIKEITELRGIDSSPKAGLRIGALVTVQELIDSDVARQHYPALISAAVGISSPQIRNMGTVAGDLCQRPRCWYYRAGYGLFARDEQGKSLVLQGDHRYHAILGNSGPAYYVCPSSLAPPLIAFGARVRVFGPKGGREVSLEKFFLTPQSDSQREHDLASNEIVTEIVVPPAAGAVGATYEVRQKEALDWPLATASVVLKLSGATIQSARVVLGHVAPIPWLSSEAAQVLVGNRASDEVVQAAANAAVSKAKDLGRNGYKIQLARVAVKRALSAAARGGNL